MYGYLLQLHRRSRIANCMVSARTHCTETFQPRMWDPHHDLYMALVFGWSKASELCRRQKRKIPHRKHPSTGPYQRPRAPDTRRLPSGVRQCHRPAHTWCRCMLSTKLLLYWVRIRAAATATWRQHSYKTSDGGGINMCTQLHGASGFPSPASSRECTHGELLLQRIVWLFHMDDTLCSRHT